MSVNPTRRLRRVTRRRGEIMAIAKKMFLARPYPQVSVEEIALQAGLSKATVYSYFKDKLDIYSAIILTDAKLLSNRIQEALDPARSTADNLRAMMRAYLDFFLEHPEYFEKLSWFYFPGRERHLSKRLVKEVGSYFGTAPASIEKCLQLGIERRELRCKSTKSAALVIYSQWLGLTYLAIANPKLHPDFNALANAACDLHLTGLLPVASRSGPHSKGQRGRGDRLT